MSTPPSAAERLGQALVAAHATWGIDIINKSWQFGVDVTAAGTELANSVIGAEVAARARLATSLPLDRNFGEPRKRVPDASATAKRSSITVREGFRPKGRHAISRIHFEGAHEKTHCAGYGRSASHCSPLRSRQSEEKKCRACSRINQTSRFPVTRSPLRRKESLERKGLRLAGIRT